MNRCILYMLFLALPSLASADLLTDIINKTYEAKTLSASTMDSLLNPPAELTPDEAYLPQNRYSLHYENAQKMFRHSFWANYYLMDKKKNERIPLSDTLIRDAQLSPNGQYVAYGKGQNLYVYKVLYKTEVPILEDTYNEKNDIFYGLSDWLYEEEFGLTRLFWFSPESKQVAFVRLDEAAVPTFSWQVFRDRSYPDAMSLRYPKSGAPNAEASVCVYDISTKGIRTMKLPEMENAYIPRLYWRSEDELVIERISRDQNQMEVYLANPKSTVCTLLYKETSEQYYVDYSLFDQWQWLTDGRIIAMSEKNGWRQLYLLTSQGAELKTLTPQGMDVTAVYGVNEKTNTIYYQAAPKASNRAIYSVNLKSGKVSLLTDTSGMHSATFSRDMKRLILCSQSDQQPNCYTLYQSNPAALKSDQQPQELAAVNAQNDSILQAWNALNIPQKQFLQIPTERGDTLDAWMILPNDIQEGQQYPVVMMQYSGPASQRVLNRWRHRFAHVLASEGYIVVNADPRGTDCRGRAWRNATYMHLGTFEAEDHLSVARYMQSLPYVDKDRIAMLGWSYGGFQTIRTMMEQTDETIRCGIAIAPVTDWRLYDTGYTERFMRRPQVNEEGYIEADLCARAKDLKGNLLLVHATGDDNVHYQNTLLLSDALVRAGKQFDTQLYVDDNHSLLDKANNEHLHRKILLWLKKNL